MPRDFATSLGSTGVRSRSSPMNAHVRPCRVRPAELAGGSTNEKKPREGASWAKSLRDALNRAVPGEPASIGLLETAVGPLGGDLSKHCGIHGGHNVAESGPERGHHQKGAG